MRVICNKVKTCGEAKYCGGAQPHYECGECGHCPRDKDAECHEYVEDKKGRVVK